MLAKAHYKVAKFPTRRGVSIQQLQSDHKAPDFLDALQHFLTSHVPQDRLVLPVESDTFNVFNHLYIESRPSVVTGHSSGWRKIRAKPKVAARGRKAKSPARFDTAFVWDKGHRPSFFQWLMVCTWLLCRGKYALTNVLLRVAYRTSMCHIQAPWTSWTPPTSAGIR